MGNVYYNNKLYSKFFYKIGNLEILRSFILNNLINKEKYKVFLFQ